MTSNQAQPPPPPPVAGYQISRMRTVFAIGRSSSTTTNLTPQCQISLAPTEISSFSSFMTSSTTTTNGMNNKLRLFGTPTSTTTLTSELGVFPIRYGRASTILTSPPKLVAVVDCPDAVEVVQVDDPKKRRVVTVTRFKFSSRAGADRRDMCFFLVETPDAI